ncbi:hypothetical protein ACVBEQ_24815 [Nakamurella sp. GG22]
MPMLGTQVINAQVSTDSTEQSVSVSVESVSDPNIIVTPNTHGLGDMSAGSVQTLQWRADFSQASPGVHRLSLIAQTATRRIRIIKKIFVLGVVNDPATGAFRAEFPEGRLEVRFTELLVSDKSCDGKNPNAGSVDLKDQDDIYRAISDRIMTSLEFNKKIDCPILILPSGMEIAFVPNPAYDNQFGPLPFADPSAKEVWTAIFAALVFLALLIAFLAGVAASGATVVFTGGAAAPAGAVGVVAITACCNPVQAVAIAVAVGAGVGAAIAGAGDYPNEPFHRGQQATTPPVGTVTTAERLDLALQYVEPIVAGTPYAVEAKWSYTRELLNTTTGDLSVLTHQVSEKRTNEHLLSRYEVEHPDIVRIRKDSKEKAVFVVKARFFGPDDTPVVRDQLFVQCYLEGTGQQADRWYRFLLHDSGIDPDSQPDGTFTGQFYFSEADLGEWDVTVLAQDVNLATEDMTPEEAATYVGSQVLTNQLEITTSGGTCPFTPDGMVRVIFE